MTRRRLSLNRHPSVSIKPPSIIRRYASASKAWDVIATWSNQHLNFYRVHMLVFILVPFTASGIFYASNGDTQVAYIDCLFMCVSAMTVTGLNTVVLSILTRWQQVMLYFLMVMGSMPTVSIVLIAIRRHFFKRKLDHVVSNNATARRRADLIEEQHLRDSPIRKILHRGRASRPPSPGDHLNGNSGALDGTTLGTRVDSQSQPAKEKKKKPRKPSRIRADMISRVNVPVRVNQMNASGFLSEKRRESSPPPPVASGGRGALTITTPKSPIIAGQALSDSPKEDSAVEEHGQRSSQEHALRGTAIHIDEPEKPTRRHQRRLSVPEHQQHGHNPRHFPRHQTIGTGQTGHDDPLLSPVRSTFPNARTIELREPDSELRLRHTRTNVADPDAVGIKRSMSRDFGRTMTRTGTIDPPSARETGFGGFPNPIVAVARLAHSKIPVINKATAMPRTTTITSVHTHNPSLHREGTKAVSYISFDAVVGRNSNFKGLTAAQREELGGVEFRALTMLFRIVIAYYLGLQLISVLVLAPWLTYSNTYKQVWADNRDLPPVWFVFFQIWSAFSNLGMSLVDASMVPFQSAYLLIIVMILNIWGGNTAYPVFLRLVIWTMSKVVPSRSRSRETLQFLLDHPRRCFIYLFPSHQTWLLVFVLILLNGIDWVSFVVLDIGNSTVDALSSGVKAIDGLFQAAAVRAAGFAIVSIADTAPALQMLYVVMMYIAVYPIAVSIRSTNVYEEKSMGIFEDGDEDEDEAEAQFDKARRATSYIAYHARRQLAFDMWWLVLALWLLCIIERTNIQDPATPWFSIFSLTFEVASAYGTVGLSLGTPTKATSLCGTFRTLSKLVLVAVMIRGRHRGLPLSVDRAVLLPDDLIRMRDETIAPAGPQPDRELNELDMAQNHEEGPLGGDEKGPTRRRRSSSLEPRRGRDPIRGTGGGLERVEPQTDAERARSFSTSDANPQPPPPLQSIGAALPAYDPLGVGVPSNANATGASSSTASASLSSSSAAGTGDEEGQESSLEKTTGESSGSSRDLDHHNDVSNTTTPAQAQGQQQTQETTAGLEAQLSRDSRGWLDKEE